MKFNNSLRLNIAYNFSSQIYMALIGIITYPFLLKKLGAEAYGLIGFFSMMQTWFSLLDMGLSPTISRQTTRFLAGRISNLEYYKVYKALNIFFILTGVVGLAFLILISNLFAASWFKLEILKLREVLFALQVMSIVVVFRWSGGFFRGIFTGSERFLWLSFFNISIATLRFVFVFPVLAKFGFSVKVFFLYQLLIAIVEYLGLFLKTKKILPPSEVKLKKIIVKLDDLKSLIKFSLTIAITSAVWILVTQTDKLILSGVLSLREYGYYSLAVLVASGIIILGGAIGGAIMPRIAKLYVEGLNAELVKVYRQSTQVVSVVCGSAAISIYFLAYPLLYLWTGNAELAEKTAPILKLYVIGNGILSLGAFPYYLQFGVGDLKYHFYGNLILLVLLLPTVIFISSFYGAVGAGYVWLFMHLIYFCIWIPYTHYKLNLKDNYKWFTQDILFIVIPTFFATAVLSSFFEINYENKGDCLVGILIFVCVAFVTSVCFSSVSRAFLREKTLEINSKYL